MFIIVFVSDEERSKFGEYIDPKIEYIKEIIKQIRSIDKLMEVLIDHQDEISVGNIRFEYYEEDKILERKILLGKYFWNITQNEIKSIINHTPIFYITERDAYIPITKGKRMLKGILEERGIKIEIRKDSSIKDINDDNFNEIKINVISSDEEKHNILLDECNGKLLFINLTDFLDKSDEL